ncbi:MAG: hypothetical protein M1813_002235 [Trichoglossum hirsutum]|nr:MAG: hypothetical protein M1813_002235 [Trichoglossum hirsutum]
MSVLQTLLKEQHITPPSNFVNPPLTPPPTDKKPFTQASRVIALFKLIEAGRHIGQHPWTEFQLTRGEYDEIEHRLEQDEWLWGFVKDKIRYDYDARRHRLVVRMPTAVHELLIDGVEDAIRCELKTIRSGSDKAALFAQQVSPARSTIIYFPVDDAPPTTVSKHEPDASFWHADAEYPGVIIEVSFAEEEEIGRLAEEYLLDSDAIQEIADEAFRDDQGNPTDHPGLRLQLSDFACEGLTTDVVRGGDREILLSTQQLCQYLTAAEDKVRRRGTLAKNSLPPGVKKRKRSRTPPERMASDDEAKYAEQERKAAKRISDDDPDYEHTSMSSTLSE